MNKKVLIIEDDQELLELLEIILSDLNIDIIKSQGILTVAEIETLSPDVILLDHLLTGGLGSDLCLKIKSNPKTKSIPVILLSACNDLDEIALKSNTDSHLAKPFEIDDLIKMIQHYVV